MTKESKLRAKFTRGDNGKDYVEITIIGDPNTFVRQVTPEDVQQFPREWQAYSEGKHEIDVGGTPLSDVPGIDNARALAMRLKGVRNAEELAGLDEAAIRSLGIGSLTLQKAAKMLLELNALKGRDEPKRVPKPRRDANLEDGV